MKKTPQQRQAIEDAFALKLLGTALTKVAESTANKYRSRRVRDICQLVQLVGDDIWEAAESGRDLRISVESQSQLWWDEFVLEDHLNQL